MTHNTPPAMKRWLSIKDVCTRYSVTRSTVYRMTKSGSLPPAHRLGAGCSRWSTEELDKWDEGIINANAPAA